MDLEREYSLGSWRRWIKEVSYPLEETDQYEDQSKDILNSTLKEELSDSNSDPKRL